MQIEPEGIPLPVFLIDYYFLSCYNVKNRKYGNNKGELLYGL